jgi:hypothetical protein
MSRWRKGCPFFRYLSELLGIKRLWILNGLRCSFQDRGQARQETKGRVMAFHRRVRRPPLPSTPLRRPLSLAENVAMGPIIAAARTGRRRRSRARLAERCGDHCLLSGRRPAGSRQNPVTSGKPLAAMPAAFMRAAGQGSTASRSNDARQLRRPRSNEDQQEGRA